MKNNPPVGSLPEEVADDIPAMISEGEFVIPADVVRYVGLDKIHGMMQEAKMGLKSMEQDGLIVDVDEEGRPEQPQEEPKKEVAIIDMVQIEKVKPMVKELKEGGVVSPILNPEEEVNVMNQGGMLRQEVRPDGSLRVIGMQEGGMPMQMEQMMAEEMPQEEMPQEAPDMAEEMPPAQTDRMADAPTLNAPLAQVINDVPHVLAYLQEDEIKALHSAGRGLDEEGKQQLSPEGVPVFIGPGDVNDAGDVGGNSPSDPVGGDGTGNDDTGGPTGPGGPDSEPGDSDDDSMKKMQEELTKEDKQSLDPSGSDRIYKEGVGFIDKIINKRLQSQVNRPNPLQGMPQYNVAKVAQGGLMRSPVYLDNGGMLGGAMDDEDNRRFEGSDAGGSIPSDPVDTEMDNIPSPAASPVVSEQPVASEEPVTSTVPEGIMQPDGAIVSESGITMRAGESDLRRDLSAIGGVNQASIDYLSQNFDVAQSILGGEEKDGATINQEALRHFNEFGKNEDREGDGQFQAQLRFPDLVDDQGNPTSVAGPSGYYDAAKILEDQPQTSDAALDYLTKNKDVFENATGRVESDEGVSYEDVAKEHFNLFGKDEDRRGTEGLMSMRDDAPEGRFGIPTPVPDAPLTDGIMSPPEEPAGSYIYNKDMFANNAEMLDQETNELLRSSGIDSGEFDDSVREYRAGNTSSLDSELVDNLNKLDDKRRIIKEGITLDDIPEGATNRDIYKKVFFNQTDDFGEKYLQSDQGIDYDSNRYDSVENILNADLSKFDPKTRKGAEALAYLQLFKLDDPASETDLKYINRAIKAISQRQQIPGYDDRGTYDTNPYENTYRQSPTWEWSREARLQRIDDLMEGRTTDMTDAERNRHLKEDVFKVA